MLRFSANLSTLFPQLPLRERFAAAAAEGFKAVEIQFPYELPAPELAELLYQHNQRLVLFNLPAGDWASGERGIASHPDRKAEFSAGVEQAITYATATSCKQINCLAGIRPKDCLHAAAHQQLKESLIQTCQRLADNGISLLLEPINHHDIPGFFINTSSEAVALITECNQPNLGLQFDIYHAAMMSEPMTQRLSEHISLIGHIQLADRPGRQHPGSGAIDFPHLFNHLQRIGYTGHIGLEYFPANNTDACFNWMHDLTPTSKNRNLR